MPPKPSHQVTGLDHNDAICIDWSKCVGCQLCTTKCTFDVLEKGKPKSPPQVHATRPNPEQQNTDLTRILLKDTDCVGCGHCTSVCNFGALKPLDPFDAIMEAKKNGKKLVAMIAPSTRLGVAECMGMPIGTTALAQLVLSLRKIGFDYVFDVDYGADKTTFDDHAEVMEMREKQTGPAITSCCPAWIELLEKDYPDLIPKTSTARSPIGCLAALIKRGWANDVKIDPENLYTVGIMPCVAKKVEAARPQIHQDYDASVTSVEVSNYFRAHLADEDKKFSEAREAEVEKTEEGLCDLPFRRISGGSNIFGKTGGVSETVFRVIAKNAGVPWNEVNITKEEMYKHASGSTMTKVIVDIKGTIINGIVCHGGFAIRKACDMVRSGELTSKNCDVIEMMACLGGCLGGAGQPKIPPAKKAEMDKRRVKLDDLDYKAEFKAATENTDMLEFVKSHFDAHGEHEHLHTYFEARYPQA
ncbi:iron-dependent hydrogenase, putative [Entamoeba invadens IP1]|uniref:Iron-dependent hydrogenase, putative n=1 Tax=Entamoeba invadens IP1 TaxID=370355 RepID=A0A0A1U039_ENTIV|nr:iron-dependent hydrogenase, putative [Entamoeba invadens IP1]ELP84258.1 iron-dependent hydrogenase, putative [Entamoeba invadens IP1]|eukprot:XP_004183604.1 iron-dependent hydrogenase, putative [Entamoeba invadens IP1]